MKQPARQYIPQPVLPHFDKSISLTQIPTLVNTPAPSAQPQKPRPSARRRLCVRHEQPIPEPCRKIQLLLLCTPGSTPPAAAKMFVQARQQVTTTAFLLTEGELRRLHPEPWRRARLQPQSYSLGERNSLEDTTGAFQPHERLFSLFAVTIPHHL